MWDNDPNDPKKQDDPVWSSLIDKHIKKIYSYDRNFFKNYMKESYQMEDVEKFDKWVWAYLVVLTHYVRRVFCYDYSLIYDSDVVINNDFSVILDCVLNDVPVLIHEPMNVNCDKGFFNHLVSMYGEDFIQRYKERNPMTLGFNAGFQGIDLQIFDDFLSVDRMNHLMNLFESVGVYNGIYDEEGNEIMGPKRTVIDTLTQSFYSLMNVVRSRNTPHILDLEKYYVVPNWGVHPKFGKINRDTEFDGWELAMNSEITHFIGHRKAEIFYKKIDQYLTENGFGDYIT
jgi:hypothetical protein